jgi:hypothetical protein
MRAPPDLLLSELSDVIAASVAERGGAGGAKVLQLLLDLVDDSCLPDVERKPGLIRPPFLRDGDRAELQAVLGREVVHHTIGVMDERQSVALRAFRAQCSARCLDAVRQPAGDGEQPAVAALASILRCAGPQLSVRVHRVTKMLVGSVWPSALRFELWMHYLGGSDGDGDGIEAPGSSRLDESGAAAALPPMPTLLGGLVRFAFESDLAPYGAAPAAEGASSALAAVQQHDVERRVVAVLQASDSDETALAGANLASRVGTAFVLSLVLGDDARRAAWGAVPRCVATLAELKAATRAGGAERGATLAAHVAAASPALAEQLRTLARQRRRGSSGSGTSLRELCTALCDPWLEASLVGFVSVDALLFVWDHAIVLGWAVVVESVCAQLLVVLEAGILGAATWADAEAVVRARGVLHERTTRNSRLVQALFRNAHTLRGAVEVPGAGAGSAASVRAPPPRRSSAAALAALAADPPEERELNVAEEPSAGRAAPATVDVALAAANAALAEADASLGGGVRESKVAPEQKQQARKMPQRVQRKAHGSATAHKAQASAPLLQPAAIRASTPPPASRARVPSVAAAAVAGAKARVPAAREPIIDAALSSSDDEAGDADAGVGDVDELVDAADAAANRSGHRHRTPTLVKIQVGRRDGKLGLRFGVDPLTGCPTVLAVLPNGAVGRLHAGKIDQGDTLASVNGVRVETFATVDTDGDARVSRAEAIATLVRIRGESALLVTEADVDALWKSCEEDSADGATSETISLAMYRGKIAATMLESTLALVARQVRPFTLVFAKLDEEVSNAEDAMRARKAKAGSVAGAIADSPSRSFVPQGGAADGAIAAPAAADGAAPAPAEQQNPEASKACAVS